MTPTLMGRWQTRIVLLATLGSLVSIPFALYTGSLVPFAVLAWVIVLGLAWDALYSFLQAFRWERDWPPAFAVLAAIAEGAVVYLVGTRLPLPGIPPDLPLTLFIADYGLVWLVTFFFAQGPMRAIFPWWRFHGGRIWPGVARGQRR
jgi:hypothetical protein